MISVCGLIMKKIVDFNEIPALSKELMEDMLPYESMCLKLGMRETGFPIAEYEEQKIMYHKHLRFWNYVIEKYNINSLYIDEVPHYQYTYIIYALAQVKKIPTLIVTYTSIENIAICPFPISQFCYGDESKPQMEMPQEYFFYPAQFWAHKNHITVLKALELLKVKYKEEPTMFFTGSDKGNRRYIEEETERIGIDKQIVFTGFLTNQEIKYMYTHATAMVYPSLMGPNNLPPIEAVYLNCPLIVSNLDGHIEQLGDGVIYFDGTDEAQLAECLHNMLNQEYRNNVIQRQQPLRTKLSEIKYCKPVWSILEEFIKIRRCWK